MAEREHEQHEQHEHRVEQQRLAMLGTTVATFAHEVGNLLNNMSLQAQLLERQLNRDGAASAGPKRERLGLIVGEMQRMNLLLTEFRELARRQDSELVETSLATLVAEALRVQMPGFTARGVRVIQDLSAAPIVMAARDKLVQAFVNLCKNAVEAMPEGGTLTISVLHTDGEARLRVCDTGTGIPDGVAIFEPFRTTKPLGTGLGLPVVWEIVAAHRGRLCYESELGVGTTFEIVLPVAPSASEG